MFFALNSRERSFVSGYSGARHKYVDYLDSMTYYNTFAATPVFTVLKDGTLVLAFKSLNRTKPYYHAYRFDWDEDAQWFSYKDLGTFERDLNADTQ